MAAGVRDILGLAIRWMSSLVASEPEYVDFTLYIDQIRDFTLER